MRSCCFSCLIFSDASRRSRAARSACSALTTSVVRSSSSRVCKARRCPSRSARSFERSASLSVSAWSVSSWPASRSRSSSRASFWRSSSACTLAACAAFWPSDSRSFSMSPFSPCSRSISASNFSRSAETRARSSSIDSFCRCRLASSDSLWAARWPSDSRSFSSCAFSPCSRSISAKKFERSSPRRARSASSCACVCSRSFCRCSTRAAASAAASAAWASLMPRAVEVEFGGLAVQIGLLRFECALLRLQRFAIGFERLPFFLEFRFEGAQVVLPGPQQLGRLAQLERGCQVVGRGDLRLCRLGRFCRLVAAGWAGGLGGLLLGAGRALAKERAQDAALGRVHFLADGRELAQMHPVKHLPVEAGRARNVVPNGSRRIVGDGGRVGDFVAHGVEILTVGDRMYGGGRVDRRVGRVGRVGSGRVPVLLAADQDHRLDCGFLGLGEEVGIGLFVRRDLLGDADRVLDRLDAGGRLGIRRVGCIFGLHPPGAAGRVRDQRSQRKLFEIGGGLDGGRTHPHPRLRQPNGRLRTPGAADAVGPSPHDKPSSHPPIRPTGEPAASAKSGHRNSGSGRQTRRQPSASLKPAQLRQSVREAATARAKPTGRRG